MIEAVGHAELSHVISLNQVVKSFDGFLNAVPLSHMWVVRCFDLKHHEHFVLGVNIH